ncbi:MAG: hypothetical protein AB8G14_17410 [Ilumatobacter sp.]
MTTKLKTMIAGGVLAAATLTGAIATSVSASETTSTTASTEADEHAQARMGDRFAQLTGDQLDCLQNAGWSRPTNRSGPPSDEERQAMSDVAEECGIDIPAEDGQHPERGRPAAGESRPEMTAESAQARMGSRFEALSDAQRDCMTDSGLAKLVDQNGPPTAERRQELRTVAEDCGIDIPTQDRSGRPGFGS